MSTLARSPNAGLVTIAPDGTVSDGLGRAQRTSCSTSRATRPCCSSRRACRSTTSTPRRCSTARRPDRSRRRDPCSSRSRSTAGCPGNPVAAAHRGDRRRRDPPGAGVLRHRRARGRRHRDRRRRVRRAPAHPPDRGDGRHRPLDRGRRPRGARRPRPPPRRRARRASRARSTRWPRSSSRPRASERAFVLSVSHDLRTPLTSIRGYAEAMIDGTVEHRRRSRPAPPHVIAAEARRLERLVADLLDLARLDARQFSLAPRDRSTRPTPSAPRSTRSAPPRPSSGSRCRSAGEPALPADADPDRLAQIVANLVENALKYAASSDRRDARRRTARATSTSGSTTTGPGIDPDDLPARVRPALRLPRTRPGAASAPGSASRSCASSQRRWAAGPGSTRTRRPAPRSSSASPS